VIWSDRCFALRKPASVHHHDPGCAFVQVRVTVHTQPLLGIFSCMQILLLSLCLATTVRATAQSVEVNAYVPPKQSTVLATTFVDWDSLVPNSTSAGQVRHVFDNPTVAMDKLEVHITTLNPGMESHPIHRHPWEEILLIKDGDFELSINGRKQHAGPGAMVFLASNDPHNARNVGNRPATYYVLNFVTDLSHSASAKSAAEQSVPGNWPPPLWTAAVCPPYPRPRVPVSSASTRPPSPSSLLKVTSLLST
jgi:XRE family transcriptional regulator, regulator of sulfur utilization